MDHVCGAKNLKNHTVKQEMLRNLQFSEEIKRIMKNTGGSTLHNPTQNSGGQGTSSVQQQPATLPQGSGAQNVTDLPSLTFTNNTNIQPLNTLQSFLLNNAAAATPLTQTAQPQVPQPNLSNPTTQLLNNPEILKKLNFLNEKSKNSDNGYLSMLKNLSEIKKEGSSSVEVKNGPVGTGFGFGLSSFP